MNEAQNFRKSCLRNHQFQWFWKKRCTWSEVLGRGRGGGDKKTQRCLGEIFWNTCPPNPLATLACTWMSGSRGSEDWILKSSISWLPAWPGRQPLAQCPPTPLLTPLQQQLLSLCPEYTRHFSMGCSFCQNSLFLTPAQLLPHLQAFIQMSSLQAVSWLPYQITNRTPQYQHSPSPFSALFFSPAHCML